MAKKSTIALVAGVLCFAVAAALLLITFVTGNMLDTKLVGAIALVLIILFMILVFVNVYLRNIERQNE